jgi:hypothetical protein
VGVSKLGGFGDDAELPPVRNICVNEPELAESAGGPAAAGPGSGGCVLTFAWESNAEDFVPDPATLPVWNIWVKLPGADESAGGAAAGAGIGGCVLTVAWESNAEDFDPDAAWLPVLNIWVKLPTSDDSAGGAAAGGATAGGATGGCVLGDGGDSTPEDLVPDAAWLPVWNICVKLPGAESAGGGAAAGGTGGCVLTVAWESSEAGLCAASVLSLTANMDVNEPRRGGAEGGGGGTAGSEALR